LALVLKFGNTSWFLFKYDRSKQYMGTY
jgi:hypothetical protein